MRRWTSSLDATAAGVVALLVGAGFPAQCAFAAPTIASETVTNIQTAYGGAALDGIRGFRARGRLLDLPSGVSGSTEISLDLSGSVRRETRYPDGSDIEILSGPLAWKGNGHQQDAAPAEVAAALRLAFRQMAAPFRLAAAPAESLSIVGDSPEGWTRLAVRGESPPGALYDVDPKSGRILRVSDGDLSLEPDDFREVSGILFPFRVTMRRNGGVLVETTLRRVELAQEFDPGDFVPRGAGAGL